MMKSSFFVTAILFVCLFIFDTLWFGGTGSLSSIASLGAQAFAFILLAQQGDVQSGVSGTQALLPIVLLLIVKIVIYLVLALGIQFLFSLFFGRK